MKVAQYLYKDQNLGHNQVNDALPGTGMQLALCFGNKDLLEHAPVLGLIGQQHPRAHVVSCSTAGEIYGESVMDDTVSIVVVEFAQSTFKIVECNIKGFSDSFDAGRHMFTQLPQNDLVHVFALLDGSLVNGSQFVQGVDTANPKKIPMTGGLAGDAANFDYTLVGYNEGPAKGNMVLIGFYGKNLLVGHGSLGGWETFGPERVVTRSRDNRLYEIDDKNALDLYKKYLGRFADDLPGSALLFPLAVQLNKDETYTVVRTILSIDPLDGAMVFAGDIPQGAVIRFMKANFDRLIDASTQAAMDNMQQLNGTTPKLALLVSCVGRKIILNNRTDEETEAVREIFGPGTILSGFYSYGEISPLHLHAKCELQNQTMTITTFHEKI